MFNETSLDHSCAIQTIANLNRASIPWLQSQGLLKGHEQEGIITPVDIRKVELANLIKEGYEQLLIPRLCPILKTNQGHIIKLFPTEAFTKSPYAYLLQPNTTFDRLIGYILPEPTQEQIINAGADELAARVKASLFIDDPELQKIFPRPSVVVYKDNFVGIQMHKAFNRLIGCFSASLIYKNASRLLIQRMDEFFIKHGLGFPSGSVSPDLIVDEFDDIHGLADLRTSMNSTLHLVQY